MIDDDLTGGGYCPDVAPAVLVMKRTDHDLTS